MQRSQDIPPELCPGLYWSTLIRLLYLLLFSMAVRFERLGGVGEKEEMPRVKKTEMIFLGG